jgi:hypothetical protein
MPLRQNGRRAGQTMPQSPQFCAFTSVLTQTPLQSVRLPLHSPTPPLHLPFTQVALGPQAIRQAPQWAGLVLGLTQAPSQVICPVGQRGTQLPARQTNSPPHAVSLGRFTQAHMLAALQVLQGGPEQLFAQQRVPTHEPDWHSTPSWQTAPAGFLVQTPAMQVRPPPQSMPLGRFAHCHMVAAVHCLHASPQALAQQRPPTQAPEAQSEPLTQASPRPAFAGSMQRLPIHI